MNEAAVRSRGLWFSYIAVLAYLFITFGAVTHQDLLLQRPVTLPILNAKLPLVGFFAVAPVFFLINHFYLLLNLLGLSRRIGEYNAAVRAANLPEKPERTERRRLDTFVIVQMLGGTAEERLGATGQFLQAISWITLVFAPILLLLFLQLQFLPYQSEVLTWIHRVVLLVDLLLIWKFWPAIRKHGWDKSRRPFLARTAVLSVFIFSCFLATFPGEFADGGLKARAWQTHRDSELWWAKGPLFGTLAPSEDETTWIGLPFLSRALSLPFKRAIIDLDALDRVRSRFRTNGNDVDLWYQQQKPWESSRTHSFRSRNLRGAVFNQSDLRNVNFEKANLHGASFFKASLQGVSFIEANLQGASLSFAKLQGASLEKASLQAASLFATDLKRTSLIAANLQRVDLATANLQEASFEEANLQDANLAATKLQGATFDGANLQNTSLVYADLQGASLKEAILQNAMLDNANLGGASLKYSSIQGASLREANLNGASLDFASLQGAFLNLAMLKGASLIRTRLQGTSFDYADLKGASLDFTSLQGASLNFANLQGASLNYSNLQGTSLNFANLQGASLNYSNLQGASFEYAILHGASIEKSSLWRTVGAPVVSTPSETRILEPDFSELNSQGYADLIREALDGVKGEKIVDQITARLTSLCVPPDECQEPPPNLIKEKFWNAVILRRDDIDYTKSLNKILRDIACDLKEAEEISSHVADRLIIVSANTPSVSSRLEAVGPVHLPGLARHLLDAAEGRRDDCPGMKGISESAKARLRDWAGPAE